MRLPLFCLAVFINCTVLGQTTMPTTSPAAADRSDGIHLRALQSVLDARERRQDWHEAAQQAVALVQAEPLKEQLTARLSGLAPKVAKTLAAHPQADALVEVNVFQSPQDGKESLVSVTFEGLDDQINGDYFGSILAGEPAQPQAQDIAKGLVFDSQASSSLVFFLGNRGLQAGDIPYGKMKQSILAAINHQRELATHQAKLQDEQAQAQLAAARQQAEAAAQQQAADNTPSTVIPEYPNDQSAYDDGYYYPGIGVPIVILPNGFANTPEWRRAQREREQSLEHAHNQSHANHQEPMDREQASPQPAGVANPPGSAGITNPPAQSGLTNPPARSGTVNPPAQNGVGTGAGQGAPQQAPAQAPPARQAPAGGGPASGGGATHK